MGAILGHNCKDLLYDIRIERSAEGGIGGKCHYSYFADRAGGHEPSAIRLQTCPFGTGGSHEVHQDAIELLLVRKHIPDRLLGLVEFGGCNQLHRRSDLQRVRNGSDPAFYFLERSHYLNDSDTAAATSSITFAEFSSNLPEARASRIS